MLSTPFTLLTTIVSASIFTMIINLYLCKVQYQTMFHPNVLLVLLYIPLIRLFDLYPV